MKNSNLTNTDLVQNRTNLDRPVKKVKPNVEILEKVKSTRKNVGKQMADKPKVKKRESEMFINFSAPENKPTNTLENKPTNVEVKITPTRISLIIQLVGLLTALAPNRELLRQFFKLLKAFISLILVLVAVYASCSIYLKAFEWLISFCKQTITMFFMQIRDYLPDILDYALIHKLLPILIGTTINIPPVNSNPYLPDFLYNAWIIAKKSILAKSLLEGSLYFILFVIVCHIIINFALYAISLPGTLSKKLITAFAHYIISFYNKCKSLFSWIFNLFSGGSRPGTGWIGVLWKAETQAEKKLHDETVLLFMEFCQLINDLNKINKTLDAFHTEKMEDSHPFFYSQNRIDQCVTTAEEIIDAVLNKKSELENKLYEIQNADGVKKLERIVLRETQNFRQAHNNFLHLCGIIGIIPAKNSFSRASGSSLKNNSEDKLNKLKEEGSVSGIKPNSQNDLGNSKEEDPFSGIGPNSQSGLDKDSATQGK